MTVLATRQLLYDDFADALQELIAALTISDAPSRLIGQKAMDTITLIANVTPLFCFG